MCVFAVVFMGSVVEMFFKIKGKKTIMNVETLTLRETESATNDAPVEDYT